MRRLALALSGAMLVPLAATAQVKTFSDWKTDAPGARYHITVADLPPVAPVSETGVAPPRKAPRPAGAVPKTLPGFEITEFAKLEAPRLLRVAPNGDVFVAETAKGRIAVLRAKPGASKPDATETFATGLDGPFGMAFWPTTGEPQWLYVANNNTVVRFAYRSGDLKARGGPETIVSQIAPSKDYHTTRDLTFSRDGRRMFVSVGSGSNTAESDPKKTVDEAKAWDAQHGLGAAWGHEENRADVMVYDPMGKGGKVYASGIRNCVGLTRTPETDQLWCSTNERDGLGDNLVPDYITRVKEGGFYGWPWYYLGDHEDPKYKGARPDLKGKVTVPDILLQPHNASLQMTFYPKDAPGPAAFPAEYRGDIFAAEHGSWNRRTRTGYSIIRAKVNNGVPTGEYETMVTGFVVDDASVWGRPVGVTVAKDGAVLFSDDGSGIIWRLAPRAGAK